MFVITVIRLNFHFGIKIRQYFARHKREFVITVDSYNRVWLYFVSEYIRLEETIYLALWQLKCIGITFLNVTKMWFYMIFLLITFLCLLFINSENQWFSTGPQRPNNHSILFYSDTIKFRNLFTYTVTSF
jgi:hypothetical protein